MRTPISIGNWKMHATNAEAEQLAKSLACLAEIEGVTTIVAPGFLQLARVAECLCGSGIELAGQNMHFAAAGAFTGEVSPPQLAEVASWVILGHSERRRYFCEDDATLKSKIEAACAHGLHPILAIGERAEERQTHCTQAVLQRQLRGALEGLDMPEGFVVAYEPVWAIGSGVPATGQQAQDAATVIRAELAELQGETVATSARILYGGSVKAENIAEFAAQPDLDGALVGGASLDAEQFLAITRTIAVAKSA